MQELIYGVKLFNCKYLLTDAESRSAWVVGRIYESARLSVCLFVCTE